MVPLGWYPGTLNNQPHIHFIYIYIVGILYVSIGYTQDIGTDTWRVIPGLGYVVNNHGDRTCPIHEVVGPLLIAYKSGLVSTYQLG